ncbi:MAG: DUF1343 domain-containing protein [Anaerolineae bacterium]|nr:DUF1343 domain-containing protein [Anaerolineae bacterium]
MFHTGLEVLISEQAELLKGWRVGLVTHPAAVLPDMTGIVAALRAAGVQLTALFGPEHGFDGSAADGAAVADGVDPRTGLPVFSLYGANKEPSSRMLADVDVLVFDMQDVGVRFYTYMSTLFYVLKGAAKAHKPVIILDRPNPINGLTLEGPSVERRFTSFVGVIPVPVRHGMTLGEMAIYMNVEHRLGAVITVIQMQDWHRRHWFADTGRSWVPTSPAMPHLAATMLYPGTCFLEGTNISPGRGTATPFQVAGAPWVDAYELADRFNALNLAGVRARPTQFVPGRYGAQRLEDGENAEAAFGAVVCYGIQLHITDRDALRPVSMGLHLINLVRELYPEHFAWHESHFDRLLGSSAVRKSLQQGQRVGDIVASWTPYLADFAEQRAPYLLYFN